MPILERSFAFLCCFISDTKRGHDTQQNVHVEQVEMSPEDENYLEIEETSIENRRKSYQHLDVTTREPTQPRDYTALDTTQHVYLEIKNSSEYETTTNESTEPVNVDYTTLN